MASRPAGPVVLGIETSCDETGIGIVAGDRLLANEVASSVALHARFGGVVPEVASRAHVEAFVPTLRRAYAQAGIGPGDVDAVAVTLGPGLAGALLVGVAAAKALALTLDRPLHPVHHLAAHIAVDTLEHGPLPDPCVALLVSGGHTALVEVTGPTIPVRAIGSTVDDAAGEAFDKVARLLGLGFPGGPAIEAAAAAGDPAAIAFPRGMTGAADPAYDFSFSGLKSAVARWVDSRRRAGDPVPVANVSAAFQEAVVDVLTAKAVAATVDRGVDHLVLGGGVAANGRLRRLAAQRCAAAGLRLRVPRPGLCTDNGAMVAALGAALVRAGVPGSDLRVAADSALELR